MKKVLAAACTLTPSGIQIPPSTRGSRVFLPGKPDTLLCKNREVITHADHPANSARQQSACYK